MVPLGTVDFVELNLLFGTILLALRASVVIGHRTIGNLGFSFARGLLGRLL